MNRRAGPGALCTAIFRLTALSCVAVLAACANVPGGGPPVRAAGASWRMPDPANVVVMETTRGEILIELSPDIAPAHVAQIRTLTQRGFYDGIKFHRVIDRFMAQTGDPLGTGEGGSDLPDIKGEFLFRRDPAAPFTEVASQGGLRLGFVGALPVASQPDWIAARSADKKVSAWGLHCPGVASMARDDNPDSANSQIFLMRAPYLSLDKRYSIWGRVIAGQAAVNALAAGEPPSAPDRMLRVRLMADIPTGERREILVLRTESPEFARLLAETRRTRGADFSPCDIDPPTRPASTSGGGLSVPSPTGPQ